MNRSPLNPVLTIVWILLLAGCQVIDSINPFASEEEIAPAPVTTAPADPNAPAAAPASVPNVPPSQVPFYDAVNKATAAANAVQTAQSVEEWQAVVTSWQEAIALMQQVPEGDPNHAVAQQKVTEYTGYLQYAQNNAGGQ